MDIEKFVELISQRKINNNIKISVPLAGENFSIEASSRFDDKVLIAIQYNRENIKTFSYFSPTSDITKDYIKKCGEENVMAGLKELARLISVEAKKYARELRIKAKVAEKSSKYLELLARKGKEPKARGKEKKRKKE